MFSSKPLRLVFMGSPLFAVPSLKALIHEKNFDVVAVYSQPPRQAGRGHKETPTPVHQEALKHGIPVETPLRLTPSEIDKLAAYEPDAICVAAYSLLLPQAVLDIAPCINVHPSNLPRWRGANPIAFTVLHGDRETAMCIMQMEKGLDTGPVYQRKMFPLSDTITTGALHDHMAEVGAVMLVDTLKRLPHLTPIPQDDSIPSTYASKWERHDLNILRPLDIAKPQSDATELAQRIRALSPWPGALAVINREDVKILNAKALPCPQEHSALRAGSVIHADKINGFVVRCGEGILQLTQLQRAGRNPMDAAAFLNGFTVHVGDIIS